jgi:Lon protease-like protein
MTTLEHYLETREMEADLASFQQMPVVNLLDALTMALPFTQHEKQMLLESAEPEQRLEKFLALIHEGAEVPQTVTRH